MMKPTTFVAIALGSFIAGKALGTTHFPPLRIPKPDGPNGPVPGCFGASVAIAGKFAFVGDPCEPSPTESGAGAVYRLKRSGAGWAVDRRFDTAQAAYYGAFGTSLAIRYNKLAIGAPGEGTGGVVHVFDDAFSDTLSLANVIKPFFPAPGAGFGASVAPLFSAFFGGFVIGAPYGACPSGGAGGFAYPTWDSNVYACNPEVGESARFGSAAMSFGKQVLIGAPGSDSQGPSGAAYLVDMGVFGFESPKIVSQFVPSDPAIGRLFGVSLATNGSVIAIGAPVSVAPGSGEVWVYRGSVPNWYVDAILVEPVSSPTPSFGRGVALSGDVLWVGSPNTPGGGAVYEFVGGMGSWAASYTFAPEPADASAGLGTALAADGATWIAGAPAAMPAGGPYTGAVYISADDYLFTDNFE